MDSDKGSNHGAALVVGVGKQVKPCDQTRHAPT